MTTVEIIKDMLIKEKSSILEKLECNEIYFSMEKICYLISIDTVSTVDELASSQEEADTKLLLHTNHAQLHFPELQVVVRSHSGDTDVNVLFVSKFTDNDKIFLDIGTGVRRKVFNLTSIRMNCKLKEALIGFHAFTGNDYVSSFFKKSKDTCWLAKGCS